ncbi:MAG TPA: hypothetical protein PLG50_05445 [bacterium]|nr:hypothetical protein [bacterium]HQG45081.1 hypothetical protein [bacterium]HQI49628.1 hypothetical protein [bacterium]HQJ66158.1 hypothetical protein [bacterium]
MAGIAVFGGITLLILASMAGLAFLVIKLARMMGGMFRTASGWEALANQYPGTEEAPVETRTGAVKVGSVYLRYGSRFGSTPEGLYLVYKSVYSYPPLLIPWHALHNPKKTLLFWRSARSYDIGNPAVTTLTLWEEAWRGLKSDLPAPSA